MGNRKSEPLDVLRVPDGQAMASIRHSGAGLAAGRSTLVRGGGGAANTMFTL